MAWLKRSLLPIVLGLAVTTAGTLVRAVDPTIAQIVRERVFDVYQRIDPPTFSSDLPIRIVDIDDASLAVHGQWPWPRTQLANLVTTLQQAGSAVVAFDMLFPEHDRASPQRALAGLPLSPDLGRLLEEELNDFPSNDEVFANALAQGPTVLGVATALEGEGFTAKSGLASVGPNATSLLTSTPAVINNLPILQEATQGLGGIHVSARDDDAVVRRIPVLTSVGESVMPSMFIEALRVAQGAQSLVLRSNPSPTNQDVGIPQDLRVGALTVPLSSDGTYRIRYGALDPTLTLTAQTVLAAQDEPSALVDQLSGTIVLIGTSAPGLFDLRATPLGTIVPGVTMHAQALANVLLGEHLARPDWTDGLELVLILIAGLIVVCASLALRPVFAAGVATVVVGLVIYGSWWAFSRYLLLVDATLPFATTLLTFGAVTVPILIGTDQRQRFIRNAFAHYLAEPVLARLEGNPDALKLEGERRSISVLFMDIRGFTSRSELMEPIEAVDLLNALLDPLSEAVLDQEGTIDKFMGDGMMAFWNAPLDQSDHARRAIYAAQNMQKALETFNQAEERQASPLAIGIGIHTGEAFVGNMGSKRRFAYSAIGDTVNLAARVEALTGSTNHAVLVTEETLKEAVASDPQLAEVFDPAGEYKVKGRERPTTVFSLKKSTG